MTNRNEVAKIITNSLQEAEMRQGCTNHSFYAEIIADQIDKLYKLPDGLMSEETEKLENPCDTCMGCEKYKAICTTLKQYQADKKVVEALQARHQTEINVIRKELQELLPDLKKANGKLIEIKEFVIEYQSRIKELEAEIATLKANQQPQCQYWFAVDGKYECQKYLPEGK